ncbi:uncharacterized protein BROUX77_002024 [Berkeleyomyces rouxiae]|uniref:uncharacterized protein n=1 Tax=Berkeleyomyces rouxiae TaxID=2035830 RepID=UPI003B7A04ED
MRTSHVTLTAFAALAAADKRGLVFVPNSTYPEDNQIWVQNDSDLTWYYNYEPNPSPAFTQSQAEFEFVPMMWGVNISDVDSDSFYQAVKSIIDNRGINITHALSYNEPDGIDNGGSNVTPRAGARGWVANMIPLRELGIKVGLPACTGQPYGLTWTQEFLGNCSQLISNSTHTNNCTFDFLPVHCWPDTKIWVTEFAYAWQSLSATTDFFNDALAWLDNNDNIERYSYFGSFRSQNSNVGPNTAFLNRDGKLTDLGSLYLSDTTTGVTPESAGSSHSVHSSRNALASIVFLSLLFI